MRLGSCSREAADMQPRCGITLSEFKTLLSAAGVWSRDRAVRFQSVVNKFQTRV